MDHNQIKTSSEVMVDVIRDASRLDSLKPEWEALFDSSPTASPPLRWDWVSLWWRSFGPIYSRPDGLFILTVRRKDQLIGVLPLYRQSPSSGVLGVRRLRFISTGAAEFEETCSEYLDLLHAPSEAQAGARAVSAAIGGTSREWDQLILGDMSSASSLTTMASSLKAHGRSALAEDGTCYLADLSQGFEAYLAALSGETRREARKLLRQAERANLNVEVAHDAASAGEFFDQLVVLHRKRWSDAGLAGSFAPRHAAFHRSLLLSLTPSGAAFPVRVSLDGEPIAIFNCHRVGDKLDIYQQGVIREMDQIRSPGTAASLLLMQQLAERGIRWFDQLKGGNAFKERFCKTHKTLIRIDLVRPNIRTGAGAIGHWGSRVARKAVQLFRSAVKRPSIITAIPSADV